ncbi:hypothetical protein C8R41DRAFT_572090 [Lentinula lateritia]|uniref:EH domain-containing protein n=1 Tax=Lentinula lateritia TaxID=40482 RepID=A0ABQ8VUG2_9AGAR|nr:hypothetical protein C8R41DRAFT_572090 [Lentinula lateritia]
MVNEARTDGRTKIYRLGSVWATYLRSRSTFKSPLAIFNTQTPPKDTTLTSTQAFITEPSSTPSASLTNQTTPGDLAQLKKAVSQNPHVANSIYSSPPITSHIPSPAHITPVDLQEWNVPATFISHSHKLFDQNDHLQKGYLDAETEVLPLYRKARLTDGQLSRIWHTLGVRKFTRFTKDNFTGGLFLVYRALAGLEIPEDLPESFATAFSAQTQSADPFDHEVSSSSSGPVKEDEVGSLYAQIRTLQDALTTASHENEDLRSSVQTLNQLSRHHTVSLNRMSFNVDSGLAEIARLESELLDKNSVLTRLPASLRLTEDLSRENAVLRLQIEELTSRLEISHGDVAAQELIAEELTRETERLKQQLDDLRETSTHVPSVAGDQELQNLINEDLSRENRQLRNQASELQETLSQLQIPNDELDSLKGITRVLTRENKRLQRRVREMESLSTAQEGMRQQVEQLNRDNERLRRDLAQVRRPHQSTTDVPPPAYEDIGH